MTSIRTEATDLFKFMTKDQLDTTAKVAKLLDCSFEAAVSLQLCREYLARYCPPSERAKVLAALIMADGHLKVAP